MIVGVDASSVRTGGGLTHLSKLLAAAEPREHGIRELRVWANRSTLAQLPDRAGIARIHEPWLDRSLPWRLAWQMRRLPELARDCDLVGDEACGAHALNGLMYTDHSRSLEMELIDLCNSGDTAGDRNRVVGYGAFSLH